MLGRTSDAAPVAAQSGLKSLAVHDWHFVQLSLLDVGSWFVAADPFGALRQGLVERSRLQACMPQRLPSLRRVLSWAVDNNMPLNIELKDMDSDLLNQALVAEVVRDVAIANADHLVVLSSFNHTILRICRWLAPQLAVAALQEDSHPPDLISYLHSLAVCAYHPVDQIVDAPLVHALRDAGLRVNVFTVNNPVRQRQLFAAGATGIFTDYLN
jgi:glycerophosphoryl diester phosphodiesterase